MFVIVVGMHRSGTSALAGILHANRCIMGEEDNFIPKPSEENPKGFFENYRFRRINDQIVERNKYVVKSWNPNIPAIMASMFSRFQMCRILKQYNTKYEKWGWKDPRNCLTLSIWLEQIGRLNLENQCKILFISRNPHAVAYSMERRGNSKYEQALKIWYHYNNIVLAAIDQSRSVDVFYMTFEQLLTDRSPVLTALFHYLQIPFDPDASENFFDARLNRSTVREMPEIPGKLLQEVEELKKRLAERRSVR